MKKVPLNDIHEKELGAKMTEFAGYWMPVRYSSDKEEHLTVRNAVGIFDVSHMGEFMIRGEKALDLIQRVGSNDASKLYDGKVQYSCLPNDQGGIVDDFLVYRISEQEYLMVVNASNIEKDWNWIQKQNESIGAEMEDVSDNTCLFAVQGPKACEAIQSLTEVNLTNLEYYTFEKSTFAGIPDVVIAATGYTGAGGVELYVPAEAAVQVWQKIMEAGKGFGIQPIGLGARDTLRLEKGFCLYGQDIDDTTSPLEAGLGWITKFTKDFVNHENLKKQKEEGIQKRLVAFKMIEKGIPRTGYEIQNESGEIIGKVTSGTMSPSLGIGIGMGYVKVDFKNPGTKVKIQIRNKSFEAEVIKLPFL